MKISQTSTPFASSDFLERLTGCINYKQLFHSLNDRIGHEFKTDNKHVNTAAKFSSLPRKHICANCGKNRKGAPLLLLQQFLNDLKLLMNY